MTMTTRTSAMNRAESLTDVAHAERMHEMRTPLSVAMLRVHLLQGRVQRGADPTLVGIELERIEASLQELNGAVTRAGDLRRWKRHGRAGIVPTQGAAASGGDANSDGGAPWRSAPSS